MSGRIFLGTSGFAYPEWKGSFYPEDLRDREMLGYYASRFSSVEINYTFRRMPSERAIRSWYEQTPSNFVFALKAPQGITHFARLAGDGSVLREFTATIRPLGPKLGVLLVQCPPSLPYDPELLRHFIDGLPTGFRYAMEFRHPSWEAARDVLSDAGIAWCVAETDEHEAGPVDHGPFAYLRLRRTSYGDSDLDRWAGTVAGLSAGDRDVFVYFKHEDGAAGPGFAKRLAERLGLPSITPA